MFLWSNLKARDLMAVLHMLSKPAAGKEPQRPVPQPKPPAKAKAIS